MTTGAQTSLRFAPAVIDHPTAEHIYRIVCECLSRGWNDPPIRYFTARVNRCYRQVLRALAILERSGRLLIHRRRLSATRNGTNIYEIPDIQGGCDTGNVTEKQKQKQIPSTPAPPALIPAFEALKSRLRRALEENTFLKKWNERGAHIHQARGWRKNRDLQAMRMQQQAMVGTAEAFRLARLYADMEKEVPRWN